jgi:ubiquinone/menaquinone biosynthesis C-methylase UbiE
MAEPPTRSSRWSQIGAWALASVFVLGLFFPPVGTWTGAILAAWLVGTQKPLRGFLWLLATTLIFSLPAIWRGPLAGIIPLLAILPFVFYRLVSPRLPGFLSTLPLPLAGAAMAPIFNLHFLAQSHVTARPGTGTLGLLVYWFAAVVLWMWNERFRASRIAAGAAVFAGAYVVAAFAWTCCGGALALAVWALLHPIKRHRPWANRPELALLQSPYTQSPLQVVLKDGQETLVSASGESFPIRDGIPVVLKPEDLTGANRKYNRLYETIGGFYDDSQRVACALGGMDQAALFLSYLPLLEIKPGDSVLETSVGTGLNLKYLPRGIKLFGLDLSPEMLANCETNLRRWQLDADLFLGNAERLPFADSSFDVVFHAGGINFFSDRASAIREMIRVAKPGSLILIADETEAHVKDTYERMPITSGYFKDRQEAVAAPIDLVPPEMQDVQLKLLLNDRLYALTFRKH